MKNILYWKIYKLSGVNKPTDTIILLEICKLLNICLNFGLRKEVVMKRMNKRDHLHLVPTLKYKIKKDAKQKVFLCAEQSLQRLVEVAEHHRGYCKQNLKIKKIHQKGHVNSAKFSGNNSCEHSFLWSSSPYLPNKEYLENTRVSQSFSCIGMLPSRYV